MLSSDDEARHSIENATSNSDLVRELRDSHQSFPAETPSSETSDDINQQVPNGNVIRQEDQSMGNEMKYGDGSLPGLIEGISSPLFRDKEVHDGLNGSRENGQGSSQHSRTRNNERSLRNPENGTVKFQNGGNQRNGNSSQSKGSEDPIRETNGQLPLGSEKDILAGSVHGPENSTQPEENEPRRSQDSLHDLKHKLKEINSSSLSSTRKSTQTSPDFARFESFPESPKSSRGNESHPGNPNRNPELRNSTENDATRISRDNQVLNELFADIISSTEPRVRHLASRSTLNESSSSTRRSKTYGRWKSFTTPVEEQRHAGKPGLWSENFMKDVEEMIDQDATEANATSLASTSNADIFAAGRNHEDVSSSQEPRELETEHPGVIALTFLVIGICLSVFLISLDRTIITTAIPYISGEFKSYADIGWYGSAYLLTACAFQPLYGRIYSTFSIKWSYLAANAVFVIGSLICGIAPNSLSLIIGRAIAGVGSAGILTGSFVVVAHSVPLHKRPVFTAAVGLMFGVGATVGPLLGGVFTDLATWRWCFYFNLPVGGVTILAMVVFFNPKNNMNTKRPFGSRVLELDIIGNVLLLGACIMLFIALQYTEVGDSWSSSKIIGLLVGFGITIIIFGLWLSWRGAQALIPLDILKQRTVLASCLFSFFIYSALILHSYYLPQWFQAIKNTSAITSGVDMIPYVVCNAFFSLLAGVIVSKSGYFTPPSIIGTAIATIGCGLISTLQPNTPSPQWIGYEILSAAGFGIAIQQGFTAVQTVLPLEKIPIGTAAVVASQSFGGAIFVSVGNNILQNQLKSSADDGQLPGVDIQAVLDAGATGFRSVVDPDQLSALLIAYNGALQKVFIAAIPVIGLAFISSLFLEWKSVKTQKGVEKG
ncbi:hypothetical protein NHQ30_001415 [Ciborinia camelliae]|nr:hypothetical protein NHQ30_001415 [Ciborinia camelliae]